MKLMPITRKKFGQKLKELVNKKEDMERIALWIHNIYLSFYDNDDDPLFYEILYNLMMMELGPEFEYSYEELNNIADRLIAGEDVRL